MSCEKWRSPTAQRELRRPVKLLVHSRFHVFRLVKELPKSLCSAGKFPARNMCTDCPTPHTENDPICQVLNPGGMESQTKPETGHRGEGVCQKGCGLLLTGADISNGGHCCVDALRSVTDALEGRSATLEHEARMARLRWNRREQRLLAKVTALQNEAQLAAVEYQRRLHQYMLHITSIAEQVTGYCKVRGQINLTSACGATTKVLKYYLCCPFESKRGAI